MATTATRVPSALDQSIIQDTSGHEAVALGTQIAGEDLTNDVLKTEQRFSYAYCTADTAVKSGAGFLHTVTITPIDAAAGTITLWDNTAESGTTITTIYIPAAFVAPITLTLDVSFSTGLYVGYGAAVEVAVTLSYR